MSRQIALLIMSLLLIAQPAWAQSQPERTASQRPLTTHSLNADQQRRFEGLLEELRCLVCQNQNLKESHAPLAYDLRAEVEELILSGKDDDAIKDYLVARYGDFVLYRPRFQPSTWVLWFAPVLLLLLGLWVARTIFRSAPEPESQADRGRVDRLLNGATNTQNTQQPPPERRL